MSEIIFSDKYNYINYYNIFLKLLNTYNTCSSTPREVINLHFLIILLDHESF